MNISDLSANQLREAANIKAQIEKLQEELISVLGTGASATPAAAPAAAVVAAAPAKRTVSAATRAKMAAAQQKRWVVKQPTTVVQKPNGKSKMTPAVKALLSAKLKAYWAKRKAAKK